MVILKKKKQTLDELIQSGQTKLKFIFYSSKAEKNMRIITENKLHVVSVMWNLFHISETCWHL